MASARTAFSGLRSCASRGSDGLWIAERDERSDGHRGRLDILFHHAEQRGHGPAVPQTSQRVYGTLPHPPVGVAEGFEKAGDDPLSLRGRLIRDEDLDGAAANELVLVFDQRQDGLDDLGAADRAQCVGSPDAHPPVSVPERPQQVLDGAGIPHLIQDLHGGASDVLGLVLEEVEQMMDGFRVVDLDDGLDRFRLHRQVRIPKSLTNGANIHGDAEGSEAFQGSLPHGLVRVPQQLDQSVPAGLGAEATERPGDIEAGEPVLTVEAADHLRKQGFGCHLVHEAEGQRASLLVHRVQELDDSLAVQRILVAGYDLHEAGLRNVRVLKQV